MHNLRKSHPDANRGISVLRQEMSVIIIIHLKT